MTSENYQLTLVSVKALQKPQFMKILIYIGYTSENGILMKFTINLPDIP